MKKVFIPEGICPRSITIEIKDGIIEYVKFSGGCKGNSIGIASLIQGARVDQVIERLSGIRCGGRQTSCPDQLALALKQMLLEETAQLLSEKEENGESCLETEAILQTDIIEEKEIS